MQIDSNNIPYVAFRDCTTKASVMRYNGSAWENVGAPGFSAGGAGYTSLALDGAGIPYVAYMDMITTDFKASVMKYDGANWVYVGLPEFSDAGVGCTSLVIDKTGSPCLAYADGANSGRATVMRYDGSNWVPVGTKGFTPGAADDTFLAVDSSNTLFITYRDNANGQKASVMKFDGINWVNVGLPGFSPADVLTTTIAVNNNGNIYVAFKDGNTANYYVSAMKFESASAVYSESDNDDNIIIYPNPNKGVFQIQYNSHQKGEFNLNIVDAKGKVVYKDVIPQFNGTYTKLVDLGRKAKGVYFLEITSGTEKRIKKIILE